MAPSAVGYGFALVVVWLTRFPLVTLLIAFWSWYLSLDLVRWIAQEGQFTYSDREQLLSLHAYSHFHGRAADVIDARLHHDEVTEVNRLTKIDSIDRRGDNAGA